MSNLKIDDHISDNEMNEGVVISVMSPRGGTGKTSVASLLGAQIPKITAEFTEQNVLGRPFKVCLIDLDIFDGQVGFLLGESKPTVLDLARYKDSLNEEVVMDHLVFNETMGFHALLAPLRGDPDRDADPAFYHEVIRLLKNMFDVVIIDTSVDIRETMNRMVAIPAADQVLLVLNNNPSGIGGGQQWVKDATTPLAEGGLSVDVDTISVVFNSLAAPVKWNLKEMSTILGAKPQIFIPYGGQEFSSAGYNRNLAAILERDEFNTAYTYLVAFVTTWFAAKNSSEG